MTSEDFSLQRARESLRAARLLAAEGLPNISSSRSYYAMFYVAEALLNFRGLTFSSHSAVIAAYGKEFARSGDIDPKFHKYLIASQNARQIGDYGGERNITQDEAEQIAGWEEEFLQVA